MKGYMKDGIIYTEEEIKSDYKEIQYYETTDGCRWLDPKRALRREIQIANKAEGRDYIKSTINLKKLLAVK